MWDPCSASLPIPCVLSEGLLLCMPGPRMGMAGTVGFKAKPEPLPSALKGSQCVSRVSTWDEQSWAECSLLHFIHTLALPPGMTLSHSQYILYQWQAADLSWVFCPCNQTGSHQLHCSVRVTRAKGQYWWCWPAVSIRLRRRGMLCPKRSNQQQGNQ